MLGNLFFLKGHLADCFILYTTGTSIVLSILLKGTMVMNHK